MPNQSIGSVRIVSGINANVQIGQATNPKVPAINYGGRTLKSATDLSLVGVQNTFVITYNTSSNTFYMSDAGAAITGIDAGFF